MTEDKQELPLKDWEIQSLLNKYPSALPNWILMCSYAYYMRDESLVSDHAYEALLKMYGANRAFYENHRYSHLIRQSHIDAGSQYDIPLDMYPNGIINAAEHLISGEWGIWKI